MEVKSGEGTVVVADRNRYSDECCNNRGWGSGWGAVGGANLFSDSLTKLLISQQQSDC